MRSPENVLLGRSRADSSAPGTKCGPTLDELLSRLVEKVPVESVEPADTVVRMEASAMAGRAACGRRGGCGQLRRRGCSTCFRRRGSRRPRGSRPHLQLGLLHRPFTRELRHRLAGDLQPRRDRIRILQTPGQLRYLRPQFLKAAPAWQPPADRVPPTTTPSSPPGPRGCGSWFAYSCAARAIPTPEIACPRAQRRTR